ncbi:MAG: acriflavin resistance protein [Planctomycetales bacterium 71-10]|nr:MAG: acriflavin resistance protein [Planctomycetales bacterium 71-10]
MNPIVFALRHPLTVMVAVVAIVLGSVLAMQRTQIETFPNLNLPVIYVAQPYAGMDPAQMEGLITNYYELLFFFIEGIDRIESQNIQGMALMKLHFHPGTDMAQAMAETINYANRARAFMPTGTQPPFVMRMDTGSVPAGYLVLSSRTKSIGQIQDLALFRVRPIYARLPGVSSAAPFGGNQRTVVVHLDPEKLRSYHLSPEEVMAALNRGNAVWPSGNALVKDQMPIVTVNSMVVDPQELGSIPIKPGGNVYLRDLGFVEDGMDIPTGWALVNGHRSVYMLVTKRANASTLAVVNAVKASLPQMQAALPEDVKISFEFDQSGYVTGAMWGVGTEALLGAVLTGLMVLLFLRDWRSVVVVVLNIPLALLGAVIALWLTGQTINMMTLGGLALAVGILVDEATVEVENIHTQMEKTDSVAWAVRLGNAETAVPRLLAMLCILAVFLPSFLMEGTARDLFVPLALAVGFSMLTSYLLSSTFVPVLSVWLLRHHHPAAPASGGRFSFARFQAAYAQLLRGMTRFRFVLVPAYLGVAGLLIWLVGGRIGREIAPKVDAGQLQLRLRAPTGTRLELAEEFTVRALDIIKETVGPENVEITVAYVGVTSLNYPLNAVYLWTSGPGEAVLRVALKHGSGIHVEELKERLREELPRRLGGWLEKRLLALGLSPEQAARRSRELKLAFEPADIVNQVMSFGSSTPIEVVVRGPKLADNRAFAEKVRRELARVPSLRDLQFVQAPDYPTIGVKLDRERAGLSGVTVDEVARSLVAATSSSRYIMPNFWIDPASGIGYLVQVEIPPARMDSAEEVGMVPIKGTTEGQLLVRDVGRIEHGTMPEEFDRHGMMRMVSLKANLHGEDLGRVADRIAYAIRAAGEPPRGVTVDVRGQVVPMQQMFRGLSLGLVLAMVVVFLLLTAYFQSVRLAVVAVAALPAVVAGVAVFLLLTGTTLNIQSFMGAIMAIGVAVANAILLVTFAERSRLGGADAAEAAVEGAQGRLRPILMTSCAMLAGMVPMALALGEGGEQTAPLGRAVIGGLAAATLATLLVLPSVFAIVLGRSGTRSASLDPSDPDSHHFSPPPGSPRGGTQRGDGPETQTLTAGDGACPQPL